LKQSILKQSWMGGLYTYIGYLRPVCGVDRWRASRIGARRRQYPAQQQLPRRRPPVLCEGNPLHGGDPALVGPQRGLLPLERSRPQTALRWPRRGRARSGPERGENGGVVQPAFPLAGASGGEVGRGGREERHLRQAVSPRCHGRSEILGRSQRCDRRGRRDGRASFADTHSVFPVSPRTTVK
jgi:hypothetical protein